MIRNNYENQIFGTRKIVKNYCENSDWEGFNKPQNSDNWRLGECLICGARMPVNIKCLKRYPPKRCAFCSNIGNKSNIPSNTNDWVLYDDHAVCNIRYKSQIISFYIDVSDFKDVSERTWRVSKKRNKYYIVSGCKSKDNSIYLHQYILGKHDSAQMVIDHIDGNSLNNRRNNLRYLPISENSRNVSVRIDNQIGIRGVSYSSKDKKYCVDISYDNTRYYMPAFKTVEEAVYCRFIAENYFGLHIIDKNPLFAQYDTLKEDAKKDIENLTLQKLNR